MKSTETIINPYEVKGNIDYAKLIDQFGADKVDEKIIKKLKKVPMLFRRGHVFAHRDFDKILSAKKFAIVSGRGVSDKIHLGHLSTMRLVKELQDIYDCYVFIPFSDDEKYLYSDKIKFEKISAMTYENMLDIAALGFDPKKTKFVSDLTNLPQDLYNLSIQCAKKITVNTVRSVMGFTGETNIGINFYPAMQTAHILYPTIKQDLPVVVPVGIDQDSFIKISRDVASKLNLPKPAGLFCTYLPGLKEGGKMSSSDPDSTIYTTDSPEVVKKKINKYAFSGGQATVEEHRKKGGNPEIDVAYQYLTFFLEDDKKLKKIYNNYKSGKLLTGELKAICIDTINSFLKEHQKKRILAKKQLDKFMLRK